MRLSRDEVVQKTAEGTDAGPANPDGEMENGIGSVTVSDVRSMVRPETDLEWKIVADAWNDLLEEWSYSKSARARSSCASTARPSLVTYSRSSSGRWDETTSPTEL